MPKMLQRRRVGLGEILGTVGAALVAASLARPWLGADLPGAVAYVREGGRELSAGAAAHVWSIAAGGPPEAAEGTAAAAALTREIGIAATGWEQERWVAAAMIVAAVLALLGLAKAVTAPTAGAARRFGWMLSSAGFAVLVVCGIELWWLGPAPGELLRPGTGMQLAAAGAACLVLGSMMLGPTRRRRWRMSDEDVPERRAFEHTEHLAYSNGAWVPRTPGDGRPRGDDA